MTVLAYVDPGLGLLLWQAVVSAFVGGLFYVKKTRDWILKPLRNLLQRGQPPIAPPEKVQQPETVPKKVLVSQNPAHHE